MLLFGQMFNIIHCLHQPSKSVHSVTTAYLGLGYEPLLIVCLDFSLLILQTGEGQGVIFKFFFVQKLLLLHHSYFVTTRRPFWKKNSHSREVFSLVHDNNDVENIIAVYNIFFLAKMWQYLKAK